METEVGDGVTTASEVDPVITDEVVIPLDGVGNGLTVDVTVLIGATTNVVDLGASPICSNDLEDVEDVTASEVDGALVVFTGRLAEGTDAEGSTAVEEATLVVAPSTLWKVGV